MLDALGSFGLIPAGAATFEVLASFEGLAALSTTLGAGLLAAAAVELVALAFGVVFALGGVGMTTMKLLVVI